MCRATKNFRNFQLKFMGWIAIMIAPVVAVITTAVHGLPFPASISETGTIANRVSPVLPFALGTLALFALSYAIYLAYDALDAAVTFLMAAGFIFVAVFPIASQYVVDERIGLFAVSHELSNALHYAGALTGFAAMTVWVGVCFRRSSYSKINQTPEKRIRNVLYAVTTVFMIIAVALFAAHVFGLFGDNSPSMFAAQAVLLTSSGVSILVKGGVALVDR